MTDLLLRFLFGGIIISGFAALGDIFRPKSFAGLFGAAPSIALATLGLTIAHSGRLYAAIEARSMISRGDRFFRLCIGRKFSSDALQATGPRGYLRSASALAGNLSRSLGNLAEITNPMKIEADLSALKTVKPHEYAVRFLFGGLVTAIAGVIAKHYGPASAASFLPFPPSFPPAPRSSKNTRSRRSSGPASTAPAGAAKPLSVDAAGASLGTIGLVAFAVIVWRYLPSHSAWLVLPVAALGGSPSPSCFGCSVSAFDCVKMSMLVDVRKPTYDPKNIMEACPTMVGLRSLDECISCLGNPRKLILEEPVGHRNGIFDGRVPGSGNIQEERELAVPLPSSGHLYSSRVRLDQLERKMIERRLELIDDFACDDLNIRGSGNKEMKCLFTLRIGEDFIRVFGVSQFTDQAIDLINVYR